MCGRERMSINLVCEWDLIEAKFFLILCIILLMIFRLQRVSSNL